MFDAMDVHSVYNAWSERQFPTPNPYDPDIHIDPIGDGDDATQRTPMLRLIDGIAWTYHKTVLVTGDSDEGKRTVASLIQWLGAPMGVDGDRVLDAELYAAISSDDPNRYQAAFEDRNAKWALWGVMWPADVPASKPVPVRSPARIIVNDGHLEPDFRNADEPTLVIDFRHARREPDRLLRAVCVFLQVVESASRARDRLCQWVTRQ